MAQQPNHWITESDIGSGEKTAGQQDVERDTLAVGSTARLDGGNVQSAQSGIPADNAQAAGRTLQSGTHLARIVAAAQPDGSYEAQVFVRLTREPETAETYIPAGMFMTETEAWQAAEQRAQRALREQEF